MTMGMRLTTFLALAVAAAFVVFAASRDGAAVSSFTPGGIICFEKFDANDYHVDDTITKANECDGDASPGVASDTRVKFCIGWNDDCSSLDSPVTDSNFGGVRGFIPLAATLKPSSEYPAGAIVGRLSADAVLGVLGNPCNLPIRVGFTLVNATTDQSTLVKPLAIGKPDVQKPLAADANNNNIPDGADSYPAFLLAQFDVDHDFGPDGIPNTSLTPTSDDVNGPIPPLKPIARLFGATKIYGMWVTLNFMVFEPGATVLGPDRKPIQLNPALGYPTGIALQDPTVPLAPGAISDFCAPLNTRFVSFGNTRDNPCTGIDTATTRGNCPAEIESALENQGYPLLPCEVNNDMDEDGDGKFNDGCPTTGLSPETGAQCDNNINDDPGDSESDINDGCPPAGDLGENVYVGSGGCGGTGGNEGGCEARKNSATPGTVQVPIGTQSLRDADGDGIDNSLDVCALTPNPGWNARIVDVANDPDNDGLPSECDPTPNDSAPKGKPPGSPPNSPPGCEKGIVGPDYDQDCFANRADNCPLTNQLKDPSKPATYNIPAQPNDNTPLLIDKDSDFIGDACDITTCPAADTPAYAKADCEKYGVSTFGTAADGVGSQDGEYVTDCVTFDITVGVGAPARGPAPAHNNDPSCAFATALAPTPTPAPLLPGQTPRPTQAPVGGPAVACVGPNCNVVTGVGSLSPVGTSVPAWAALLAAFGAAGMIGGLGIVGSKFKRRRE